MSALKTALTDPRVKPDPEQVLRTLTGNNESTEDLASSLASVFPLYAVPDHLKHFAEADIGDALDGAIVPVSGPSLHELGNDHLTEIDCFRFTKPKTPPWETVFRGSIFGIDCTRSKSPSLCTLADMTGSRR